MSWKVSSHQIRALLVLFSFALGCILLSHAAVIDDAHITLRVVNNFMNGDGLRWNTDERVQVYSHPLWMLLQIPAYVIVGNLYLSTIILSGICALAAVLLLRRLVTSDFAAITLVLVPLMLSKVFLSYAMCGLETPLVCGLLAWFVLEWVRPVRNVQRLYFIASLCLVARLDMATLLLPALMALLWQTRREQSWKRTAASFAPVLLWGAFSLLYYGFMLPNTRYAKLPAGFSVGELAMQGLKYLYNFSYYDSFSLLVIALALGLCCVKSAGPLRLLAYGIALNIAYVIAVGGDYMSGRFFVPAFFLSLSLLAVRLNVQPAKKLAFYLAAFVAVGLAQIVIITPLFPDPKEPINNFGINDSTARYYHINGLFSDPDRFFRTGITDPDVKLRNLSAEQPYKPVVYGFVGYSGYFAPRSLIIIDYFALTEPLLARLPVSGNRPWRIGHFARAIPEGYVHARETGDTSRMAPELAAYYEKLRLVTSGDLLSHDRLYAIVGFQLGLYDHLLEAYLTKHADHQVARAFE